MVEVNSKWVTGVNASFNHEIIPHTIADGCKIGSIPGKCPAIWHIEVIRLQVQVGGVYLKVSIPPSVITPAPATTKELLTLTIIG